MGISRRQKEDLCVAQRRINRKHEHALLHSGIKEEFDIARVTDEHVSEALKQCLSVCGTG